MIKLMINDVEVEVAEGSNVLTAAQQANVEIPTMCYHKDLLPTAACGLCIVKIKGMNKIVRACATTVAEGMEIITHDAELYETRKTVLELILSSHPDDCLSCQRNQNCELQRLAAEFGIRDTYLDKEIKDIPKDESTTSLVLDASKCVLCGRCVEVCQDTQDVHAIEFIGRGFDMRIAPAGDILLNDSPCVKCGQCSAHCPVGAIVEKDQVEDVWENLRDESKFPVISMAPAVRVAFGEGFGLPSGEITTGKMYTLFKRLGFKAIFDTNFAADLTIMEEGTEFIDRFTNNPDSLPLITSCCPAWVDYLEKYYHDMLPHFSTAKSPQQMLGAMAKTYYPEKTGIEAKSIYSVSVMPCTAKKSEIVKNEDMKSSGYNDHDTVLTTRELVRMAKSSGIDFLNLPETKADSILGEYTGAGTIFGATGGVMEAALRTAYELVTGETLENVDLEVVRGLEGVKEGEIDLKGTKVRVAVAHGLANVKAVMDKIRAAKAAGEPTPWHFVEVMACSGGCIGGGGQPYGVTDDVRKLRTAGIYKDDKQSVKRKSHENPEITKIYEDFLGKPNGHKAHDLLHTKYDPKEVYLK